MSDPAQPSPRPPAPTLKWRCPQCSQIFEWPPFDVSAAETAYNLIDAHTAAHLRADYKP